MSRPSRKAVREELGRLREAIDSSTDRVFIDIAYAVETVVRWTIEDTEEWLLPLEEVKTMVKIHKEQVKP